MLAFLDSLSVHFDSARMLTHGGSVDTEPPRVSVRADVSIQNHWEGEQLGFHYFGWKPVTSHSQLHSNLPRITDRDVGERI
jgi:hypothetical protein